MFRSIRLSVIAGFVCATLAGGVFGAIATTQNASAACGDGFLGIPAWYKGLTDANCELKSVDQSDDGLANYIYIVVLNVIEIMLRIVGYIAVFFIIYGGFIYLTSNGSSDRAAQGIKTILAAVIGMALALSAVAIKNFLWDVAIAQNASTNDFGVYDVNAGDFIVGALEAVYFIAGVLAVVMIVIAGLNYATSSGDQTKVTKAKNTILYSIIGLVIVLIAFAITKFIEQQL